MGLHLECVVYNTDNRFNNPASNIITYIVQLPQIPTCDLMMVQNVGRNISSP